MLGSKLVQQAPGRYAIQGDLSFATVNDLLERSRTLFVGEAELEIDLSGVSHADSAGLALLIEWLKNARSQHLKIKYLSMPLQLTALAEISEIKDFFDRAT